jgi:hypothetical protein
MTHQAIGATIGVSRPAVGYILRGETFRDIWLEFHTPKENPSLASLLRQVPLSDAPPPPPEQTTSQQD